MNDSEARAHSITPIHLKNQALYLTAGHPWRVALEHFHAPSGPRTLFVRYNKKAVKRSFINISDSSSDQQNGKFCIEEDQGGDRVPLTSPAWGQNGGFTASAVKLGLLEPVGHTKVSTSGYYRPPYGAALPAVQPRSRGSRKRSGVSLEAAPWVGPNGPAPATASQAATRTGDLGELELM